MGTLFQIVVYAEDETAARVAMGRAFQRADELDQKLSDYKQDSELNRFCRSAFGTPIAVSDDLFQVVRTAIRISRQTDGAFDITLGPLTHLWREAKRLGRLPLQAEIVEARKRTGFKNIQVDGRLKTLSLLKARMQLDLGGIAKGYAADQMLAVLFAGGIQRALVAASGDIRVGEPPPGRTGWIIQLEQQTVELRNQAVSTAGPAEQYFDAQGIRYSHIINPKAGLGLTNGLTVSVIAPTGIMADGWDTALAVLGKGGKNRFIKNVLGGRAIFFEPALHLGREGKLL